MAAPTSFFEDLVASIVARSESDSGLSELKRDLDRNMEQMMRNADMANAALQTLQFQQHTLGVLYILHMKAHWIGAAAEADRPIFFVQVSDFISNFSAHQARKAPEKFVGLMRKYAEIHRQARTPMSALRTLMHSITRFRLSPEHLTPMHADLCQLSLLAKNYRFPLLLLQQPIFFVDPRDTGCKPKDYMLYYYYGGMIFTGLSMFRQAVDFFQTAISLPANCISAIMIEAYKKLCLVSLLLEDSSSSSLLPKHCSQIAQRSLKTLATEYTNLVEAFQTRRTPEKLHEVVSASAAVFQRDNNLGLVKQVVRAFFRTSIQKLTQTYVTVSLEEIAKAVKLSSAAEAQTYLLEMIESGSIYAVIDAENGMVSFEQQQQPQGGDSFDSYEGAAALEKRLERAVAVATRLQGLHEEVATSTEYVKRVVKGSSGGGGAGGSSGFGRGGDEDAWSMMGDFAGAGARGSRGAGPMGKLMEMMKP